MIAAINQKFKFWAQSQSDQDIAPSFHSTATPKIRIRVRAVIDNIQGYLTMTLILRGRGSIKAISASKTRKIITIK